MFSLFLQAQQVEMMTVRNQYIVTSLVSRHNQIKCGVHDYDFCLFQKMKIVFTYNTLSSLLTFNL